MSQHNAENKAVGFIAHTLCGFIIYLLINIIISMLCYKEILNNEYIMQYGSKIALLLCCAVMSCIARRKGKSRGKLFVIPGILTVWVLASLFSVALNDDISAKGMVVSLFFALLPLLILSIPKCKNSKMHKRRRNLLFSPFRSRAIHQKIHILRLKFTRRNREFKGMYMRNL